jgi:L-lactate permease
MLVDVGPDQCPYDARPADGCLLVGMAGREGDIFRKVVGWSLVLLLFMCVLVTLQGTSVLSWMVP